MTRERFGIVLIKKRKGAEWLTLFIFVMPFLLSFLMDFLGVASLIKYSIDLAWICVFFVLFIRKRLLFDRSIITLASLIGILFVYALVVYMFSFQSPFYFLWGVRNNFRFYIAFLAFATVLDPDDIDSCFRFVDIMFWVNAATSFIQYFVMGYEQDFLGGIFGVERGCNAYSIIFFSFVIGRSVLRFMDKEETALSCFLKCGTSLLISALAELKVFFVIFVFIMVMASLFTKFSVRKVVLIIIAGLFVVLSGTILTAVFGRNSALSIDRIVELVTATNYATAEDLGRFTAIPTIAGSILTDLPSQLFGMGLGNCETSAFPICNTPFYQTHADLHYTWFSSAFLFLETGYLGLLLHLGFFVAVFVIARKRLESGVGRRLYCQLGMIFSILCIILTFYNSSLRMEVGYIAYFALALPFVNGQDDAKVYEQIEDE